MNSTRSRQAGILLPVFAARRKGDLGIGDTRAMCEWITWAAEHHVSFLQLLPINEQGPEESPYSAISSAALDPIFLTFETDEIPWLHDVDLQRARLRASRAIESAHVDYSLVRQVKRELLDLAWANYQENPGPAADDFETFRKNEAGWLDDYCIFRFLMIHFGEDKPWNQWPADCQTTGQARAYVTKARQMDTATVNYQLAFFAFVQWLCFRQWTAVRAHADAAGVKLMGDIPIGVNRHSSDVFFHRADFHLEWYGGTPPEGIGDSFMNRWGQNWGIPLYRWDQMAENEFRWWRERIARVTRVFRMFRLDHILGFYRIYAFPWPPARNHEFVHLSHDEAAAQTGGLLPRWVQRPDDSDENKQSNRADGDKHLRGIFKAIPENTEMIAEDLGWTPDYVRPHLSELGISGYRIPHWDCNDHGHPTPGHFFPYDSFACYSTHDHDPLSAIWNGCVKTIGDHQHQPSHEHSWQAENAKNTLRILAEFAGMPADGPFPPFTEGVKLRLIKALFSSHSRYACLMVTELFSLPDRMNEPGTAAGNWTFRLPWTLDQIRSDPGLAASCACLSNLILITGRA